MSTTRTARRNTVHTDGYQLIAEDPRTIGIVLGRLAGLITISTALNEMRETTASRTGSEA